EFQPQALTLLLVQRPALLRHRADAPAIRVGLIENQGRLGSDIGAAFNRGNDLAINQAHPALEDAARYAFLPPDLPFFDFAIGQEARELGAGSGAAWRPIVSLAGAEDKILAIDPRLL